MLLLLLAATFTTLHRTAATPPRLLHITGQTFRITTLNTCTTTATPPSPPLSSYIDLLTVAFDQPLFLHSPTHPQPIPINGKIVQHMLDHRAITFQGDPGRCLAWRNFEHDRFVRSKMNKNTEDNDIDLLLHQMSNSPMEHQPNVLRFIQRSPRLATPIQTIACTIHINDTLLGTYRGGKTEAVLIHHQPFHVQDHIENVYSYKTDAFRTQSMEHTNNSAATLSEANDDSFTLWGGQCTPLLKTNKNNNMGEDHQPEHNHLNLSSLSLLETKDRMAIMTQVFKGLVSDVVDGVVAGAAGPMLEQTEERAGEADSDDMRGKLETSLDGSAPIKISKLLEASLTYNLTGLLTDSVTASLSPRVASTVLDNVGSAIARAVADHVPHLVSAPISSLLIATVAERLDASLPDLLRRSLTPNLINILTRSVTHALVPSLSKSLTHNSRQRYWCWACFQHKMFCNYCHDSSTSSYYQNYYDAYYSDFFSDYYGTYYADATQQLDELQHPRGKLGTNPRCGGGSGETKCQESPTPRL